MSQEVTMLAAVTIDGWRPGIGDPSIWGWLTVANYAFAFFMIVKAAKADRNNATFWAWAAALLLALGVNKQLDLQSLLTAVAKNSAIHGGWYAQRFAVQETFILALIVVLFGAMSCALYLFRRAGGPVLGAIFGMAVLSAFVAARAASFHHMDALLNLRVLALRMNHILENLGIGIITASAILARRYRHAETGPEQKV